MSLTDLTQNSFQSGIPAKKWLELCKLYISSRGPPVSNDTEVSLSHSVLALYRSHPGDPALQEYLKCAIQEGVISLPTYVMTLFQAARSPELHSAATLDMLCNIALTLHYSSNVPPVGSIVPLAESPVVLLGTVQHALVLLRTVHSLPPSHIHNAVVSASQLVTLLLSCVTDISQVSNAQANVYLSEVNDIVHSLPLLPGIRNGLENFAMSLTLLLGDDAKAAREVHMMHAFQLAYGKGDIVGPCPEHDMMGCSLILDYMVKHSYAIYGAGSDDSNPAALLLYFFRWTFWTPKTFYNQLIRACFTRFSQFPTQSPNTSGPLSWTSFICSRLPHILVRFEKVAHSETSSDTDWRSAMQAAVMSLYRRADLITQCDRVIAPSADPDSMQEDLETPRSLTREFLKQLVAFNLLEHGAAVSIDPALANDNLSKMQAEAHDSGLSLSVYCDHKLSPETSLDDAHLFLVRMYEDPSSHAIFSQRVSERFLALSNAGDVEPLSHICRVFSDNDAALDILCLHVPMAELIPHVMSFVDKYDCETVGDPQTAVSQVGDIVLFLQLCLARFKLTPSYTHQGQVHSCDYLVISHERITISGMNKTQGMGFQTFFKALFDPKSDGIEDAIFRATPPKDLLRISASLFMHAIMMAMAKQFDMEVLTNGISFFLGPLLRWTLVGVIKALDNEIWQANYVQAYHLDILQSIIASPSCPRPVVLLTGPSIVRLLTHPSAKEKKLGIKFDSAAVLKVVVQSLGLKDPAQLDTDHHRGTSADHSRQAIRAVFDAARAGRAPQLDVDECLLRTPALKFMHLMWYELCAAADMGDLDGARQLATFVFTLPRSPPCTHNAPPLLPVFLHLGVPPLLPWVDEQPPPEQAIHVEMIVAVIASALTAALQLELALRQTHPDREPRYVLGQSSAAMARQLVASLKAHKRSPTSTIVLQRLSSSTALVSNFPVFAGAEN